MRVTGIVRRIDDLGRIVVPKEIRRNLRIKEGDPLEFFISSDGDIVLRPVDEPKFEIDDLIGVFKECNTEEQKEILKRLIDEWNKE